MEAGETNCSFFSGRGFTADGGRSGCVSQTRVAFPVNPDNPVRRVTSAQMKQVLTGQIDNWRQLGGPDLPISLVSLGRGGGARMTIELPGFEPAPAEPAAGGIRPGPLRAFSRKP